VEPVVTADSPAIASSVQICPGTRVRTLGHDPEFAPACAGRLIVGRGPGSAEGGVLRHGDFVVMSVIGLEPGPVRILGARLRYRQGIRWATQHAGWKYDFTVAPRQAG
jgi:hypothetical protein